MTDIVQFIRDRLDEDEAAALAAIASPVEARYASGADIVPAVGRLLFHRRHNPARELAEVKAKRRVLDRHYADDDGSCVGCHFANDETRWSETIEECPELRDMASVYAEHPDYEQAWRVD